MTMRYLILMLLLTAALAVGGCKHSGWVWNKSSDWEPISVIDGPGDPHDTRQVIYVLGIDGMD